jgi:iron complex outermembrane receptor protein
MNLHQVVPLLLAIATVNATAAATASDIQTLETADPVEEVIVTGQAPSPSSLSSPLLGKEELRGNRGSALGELLDDLPGVSNGSFGQGVARPIVRGLSGNRVQILTNGSDTADLSAMSSDHSPMADIAAADNVQLFRGPSALRYGNSVLGGVVNVQSGRIHEEGYEGLGGRLTAGYATNHQQSTLIGLLNAGDGTHAIHLDAFKRKSENYHSGSGWGTERSGEILNSDTQSQGAGLGYSRTDTNGSYLGASMSYLSSDYAVPNEDNADARVKPIQRRYDIKSGIELDSEWFSHWQIQLAWSDYEHDETLDGQVDGLFIQDYGEAQTELTYALDSSWSGFFGLAYSQRDLELCHDHSGCPNIPDRSDDEWDGTQGSDFTVQEGYEFAHDTPMPLTTTKDSAIFLTVRKPFQTGSEQDAEIELGMRYQPRTISANPDSIRANFRRDKGYYRDRTFRPLTLSAALDVDLTPNTYLIVTLSRQQRAPAADELYWNGDHHATFSFQLDNPDLTMETAHALEANWQGKTDESQWQLAGYFYDYSGYIYNDLKHFTDPFHGNRVYRHEQEDAQLAGLEFSWEQSLTEQLIWTTQAATNRGWLTDGGTPLPRMPSDNLSQGLEYRYNHGLFAVEWQYQAPQTRLGPAETATHGYYQINLTWHAEYRISEQLLEIDLKANNLTNRYGQQHVSWLKDYAPVMGRNISMEISAPFE